MKRASYVADLRRLIRLLEMGPGEFNTGGNEHPVTLKPGEMADFIRERTKGWRETWVLPLLRRLLEREERRLSKRRCRSQA